MLNTQIEHIINTAVTISRLPIPASAGVDIDFRDSATVYVHLDDTVSVEEIAAIGFHIDGATIRQAGSSTTYIDGTLDGIEITVFFPPDLADKVSVEANLLIKD